MAIVFDTAALITAVRSETGAAAEIVRLLIRGDIELLLDYKLAAEYRDVALRPEHVSASRKTTEEIEAIIEALEAVAVPVVVEVVHRPLSSDPNDDMVLDLAINGNADSIVTNNVKHFVVAAKRFGVRVLTPRAFIEDFRKGGIHHAG